MSVPPARLVASRLNFIMSDTRLYNWQVGQPEVTLFPKENKRDDYVCDLKMWLHCPKLFASFISARSIENNFPQRR